MSKVTIKRIISSLDDIVANMVVDQIAVLSYDENVLNELDIPGGLLWKKDDMYYVGVADGSFGDDGVVEFNNKKFKSLTLEDGLSIGGIATIGSGIDDNDALRRSQIIGFINEAMGGEFEPTKYFWELNGDILSPIDPLNTHVKIGDKAGVVDNRVALNINDYYETSIHTNGSIVSDEDIKGVNIYAGDKLVIFGNPGDTFPIIKSTSMTGTAFEFVNGSNNNVMVIGYSGNVTLPLASSNSIEASSIVWKGYLDSRMASVTGGFVSRVYMMGDETGDDNYGNNLIDTHVVNWGGVKQYVYSKGEIGTLLSGDITSHGFTTRSTAIGMVTPALNVNVSGNVDIDAQSINVDAQSMTFDIDAYIGKFDGAFFDIENAFTLNATSVDIMIDTFNITGSGTSTMSSDKLLIDSGELIKYTAASKIEFVAGTIMSLKASMALSLDSGGIGIDVTGNMYNTGDLNDGDATYPMMRSAPSTYMTYKSSYSHPEYKDANGVVITDFDLMILPGVYNISYRSDTHQSSPPTFPGRNATALLSVYTEGTTVFQEAITSDGTFARYLHTATGYSSQWHNSNGESPRGRSVLLRAGNDTSVHTEHSMDVMCPLPDGILGKHNKYTMKIRPAQGEDLRNLIQWYKVVHVDGDYNIGIQGYVNLTITYVSSGGSLFEEFRRMSIYPDGQTTAETVGITVYRTDVAVHDIVAEFCMFNSDGSTP